MCTLILLLSDSYLNVDMALVLQQIVEYYFQHKQLVPFRQENYFATLHVMAKQLEWMIQVEYLHFLKRFVEEFYDLVKR